MKKILVVLLGFIVLTTVKANNDEAIVVVQQQEALTANEITFVIIPPSLISKGTIVMQHVATGQSYTFSNSSGSETIYQSVPSGVYRVTSINIAKCGNGGSTAVKFVGWNTFILTIGSSIDFQSGGAITFICQ